MQGVGDMLRKKIENNEMDLFSYFREKHSFSTVLPSLQGPNLERMITWSLLPILGSL
jgi:hypothetical protein